MFGQQDLLRILLLTALSCATTLALAVGANAATISGSANSTLTFSAGSSESNNVTVTYVASNYVTITDSGSTLTESSSSCTLSSGVVTCNHRTDGATIFQWNLGDGDDTLSVDDASDNADVVDGDLGADVVSCGGGTKDIADYSSRVAAVSVTPSDAYANDGEVTEWDDVGTSCEGSTGGSAGDVLSASDDASGKLTGNDGDDLLTASAGAGSGSCSISTTPPSNLVGGEGDDQLYGIVGWNQLNGGNGNDLAVGGSGCDTIIGAAGNDISIGGAGNDGVLDHTETSGSSTNLLIGGPGNDVVVGGYGNDTLITVGDDADGWACNAGSDKLISDGTDAEEYNWEGYPSTGACEVNLTRPF